MKPSVALIKDISETCDGRITVTGRRFYRPEIAEKEDGGNWGSNEERELFYSFDEIEFAAESVMHKCRVHFVPPNKTIPNVREYPGFFVEKIYDAKLKRLCAILDVGYGDSRQHELFTLVQKTIDRIPNWPLKIYFGVHIFFPTYFEKIISSNMDTLYLEHNSLAVGNEFIQLKVISSVMGDGRVMMTGRSFYRTGFVESGEERELFYSFEEIEFPTESVMHKCCVCSIK